MEAKQPLTDDDWQATPEPVKQYLRTLFALLIFNVQIPAIVPQVDLKLR